MKFSHLIKFTCLSFAVFVMNFSIVHAQCNSKKSNNKNVYRTSYSYNPQNTNNSRQSSSSGWESYVRGSKDLVQLAAGNHDLSTLVVALKAAGLVETLQGKGPFTVFAPTNSAFDALPAGTLETLLKPENKATLIKVLTYHVVPGRIEANDLNSGSVKSVEGSKIKVDVSSSAVRINNAIVVKPNKRALNGVVHVIDRVILPPEME